MKKKSFWIKILLCLMAVLCIFATGCKDDDEDSSTSGGSRVIVTYYLELGSQPLRTQVLNNQFSLSKIPTLPGRKFKGLFTEVVGGTMIVDSQGFCNAFIDSNLTLYAQWENETCSILFETEGTQSTEILPVEVIYGDTILDTFPVPFVEDGKEFNGWQHNGVLYTDEKGNVLEQYSEFISKNYSIDANNTVVMTPSVSTRQCVITFDYQDFEMTKTEVKLEYGSSYSLIEFPALIDEGSKELTGWSLAPYYMELPQEGDVLTEDVTFYAIWKEYKKFYFYETQGGFPVEKKVYNGEQFNYTPTGNPGYCFDGWYPSEDCTGNPILEVHYNSALTTYYAKWVLETYRLTLESFGGGEFDIIYYTIDDVIDLPVPEKEHFTFLGWCTTEDLSDPPVLKLNRAYGIETMYAKYKGESKVVALNPMEGEVIASEITVEYGAKYSLGVAEYEGYGFVGWFSSLGENGVQLTDKNGNSLGVWDILDENTTVYAKYAKKYYINVEYVDKDSDSVAVGAELSVEEYYVEGEEVFLQVSVQPGYEYKNLPLRRVK